MADKTAEKTETHTHNAARPPAAPEPTQHTHHTPPAPAAALSPAPEAPKRAPAKPVHERFFKLREAVQNCFHATLFADVLPEDVVRRDFWGEVVQKLAPGNKIIAITEDKSWYGELIVWGSGNNWAEVRFCPGFPIYPPAGITVVGNDYAIEERGLIKKWTVVNIVDGREISTGNLTREAAANWLAEYLRMQGGRRAA